MKIDNYQWKNRDRSVEVSPYLHVHCQFKSLQLSLNLEDSPTKILRYQINILPLLRASVFNFKPFELWEGDVHINGVEVTLKAKSN